MSCTCTYMYIIMFLSLVFPHWKLYMYAGKNIIINIVVREKWDLVREINGREVYFSRWMGVILSTHINPTWLNWNFFLLVVGWNIGIEVPYDIYVLYAIQVGFYFHSIYGTVFMDIWRRDSVVMILHHVLTLCLLVFSISIRYVDQ